MEVAVIVARVVFPLPFEIKVDGNLHEFGVQRGKKRTMSRSIHILVNQENLSTTVAQSVDTPR